MHFKYDFLCIRMYSFAQAADEQLIDGPACIAVRGSSAFFSLSAFGLCFPLFDLHIHHVRD